MENQAPDITQEKVILFQHLKDKAKETLTDTEIGLLFYLSIDPDVQIKSETFH